MMSGKRGGPTFRRTTSMKGITLDVGSMEAAPPPPLAMIGGEFNGYDHMLSPRYFRKNSSGDAHVETADFLRSCGLCNRRLAPGRDIYMYRGDTAFCSLECREQQMKQDERKERRATAAAAAPAKNGESHHPELAAAAHEAETVAAA
ncbi:hypothetical protein Pfo_018711 [Paulownia fortunei]|nr:hypothetical protein Pfo_018711 [Paulownia fortunei]